MNLVILDRDGVINEDSSAYIKSPDEWRPIAGSLEAIARLKLAGFRVVIASNQSGIGRGLFDYDSLFAIHDKMSRMLADLGARVDGIFFCPHTPEAGCPCRKPAPGLLRDIERRLAAPVKDRPFIGDSLSDVEAARAAGAAPWLVRTGKAIEADASVLADTRIYPDLAAAAEALIGNPNHAGSGHRHPRSRH